jgi:catechol 2,3-dioxygenase-like lactoylglutathione lyase family enzyme
MAGIMVAPYFGVLCAMQHKFAMAGSIDGKYETRVGQGGLTCVAALKGARDGQGSWPCAQCGLECEAGVAMKQHLGALALLVDDYDEAIAWYTRALGFELIEDIDQGHKRCVLLAPAGSTETRLLLARADGDEQVSRVGNQTGGRVFLLLHTDDFQRDWQRMREQGVHFREEPRHEAYGTVAVFEDLYGNAWDLLQPA